MRRFLFALLVTGYLLPAAHAQASFGFQAGLNVANLQVSDDDPIDELGDEQPRLGLTAGIVADIPFTPSLSFHPELLFSQKGERYSAGDGEFEATLTAQINYIEVPLLLRYALPIGQNGLTIGLEGGPAVAYKVSAGLACSGDIPDEFCSEEDELDRTTTALDVGGAIGVTVGAGPFSVGGRFTQGITSINDEDDALGDTNVRNQVFSVFGRFTLGQ